MTDEDRIVIRKEITGWKANVMLLAYIAFILGLFYYAEVLLDYFGIY